MLRTGSGLWVALITATSCIGVRLEAQQPTIRDSAGVRVVEHDLTPRQAAPFRIVEAPSWDLGGLRANPSEELDSRTPFSSPQRLSDGRWVVVDWASIKVFDPNGRFVRSIASPGPGPGEFRQIRALCVAPGDTIVAISLSDRRMSAFDTLGVHLRSSVLPGEVRTNACFGDGTILVRHEAQPNPHSPLPRAEAALADRVTRVERARWDGTVVGAIGLLQTETLDWTIQDIANMAVRGRRIYVGNGTAPEYKVYDQDGTLIQIVRWRSDRIRVTNDMRESAIRRGYRVGPLSREYLPVYAAIQVGPDDSAWLQDYWTPGQSRTGYTVFNRDGLLSGRVEIPAVIDGRIELPWIGRNLVMLQWRDADGVLHLTAHAITQR